MLRSLQDPDLILSQLCGEPETGAGCLHSIGRKIIDLVDQGFERTIKMVLTDRGQSDGELRAKSLYVARLRQEGCNVEWCGSRNGEPVTRVIAPRTAISDERRNRIFRLVIGLAEVNQEPELDLAVQQQVLCEPACEL
jgi:hypothetical protein